MFGDIFLASLHMYRTIGRDMVHSPGQKSLYYGIHILEESTPMKFEDPIKVHELVIDTKF